MRCAPLIGIALSFICSTACAADDSQDIDFFEAKIRPVLVEQCYKCHSEDAAKAGKLRGGLKLDTKAGLKAGGDSGSAIVPGKPEEGILLKSLRYDGETQMPPSGKLPANVIADFEKWIKGGAIDPRHDEIVTKAGIDLEKGRQFWSLQSPKPQTVPKLGETSIPVRNPVDAFVQAKWNEKGLMPASLADKRTLIRRAAFDLTGLPPSPQEVDAFLNDSSLNAWSKLIDRLLASPQYGERWGRHWLDVARYSEDQAHTFQNAPKKNAYLYRDWVIKAFNEDMPYDHFVRLQIAGDLMPDAGHDLFTKLAGLGLMGLGADYYKNTAREQAIAEELDDRVDTLTRGFLGFTVACARCHDHKFDPIPTKDYYAIAGVFNGTALTSAPLVDPAVVKVYNDAKGKVQSAEGGIASFLSDSGKAAVKSATALTAKYLVAARSVRFSHASPEKLVKNEGLSSYFLDRWVKFLDPANAAKTPVEFKEWFALKMDADAKDVQSQADAIQSMLISISLPDPEATKNPKSGSKKSNSVMSKAMFQNENAPLLVTPADVEKLMLSNDAKQKLAVMRADAEKLKSVVPLAPLTAHVLSGNGQAMNVYIRGNPATKGEMTAKGFLHVLAKGHEAPKKDFTRLDLANAIAATENPLTARVIVNRAWAWHFGRGLVNTPSNFGALGDRPSHPELLDHLAVEFMKNGWSLKWLHRQIMLSSTYQLAISTNAENDKKDAANAFLWRGSRKRLDVEAWRDSLLAVSGNLDPKIGGPTFSLKDANSNRRTVYGIVSRHEPDGLLRIFDFPDANVTADKRNVTTVPQQQLFALNSEFMVNQARAFNSRIEKLGTTDVERIAAAYQLAFNRKPDLQELEIAERFLKLPAKPNDKLTRWQQYAQALLASNEFLYVD